MGSVIPRALRHDATLQTLSRAPHVTDAIEPMHARSKLTRCVTDGALHFVSPISWAPASFIMSVIACGGFAAARTAFAAII